MTADLDALPPAAKFVCHVLNQADGPLTRAEIERECGLPERTANDALRRLRETGVVERTDDPDVRRTKPQYAVASQDPRDGKE